MQTNIAKNTSWFTTALIIQKIIAFVYFTYLARALGAESIGQYVFTLSYITIFTVLIDFGTNHYITREIAKKHSNAQKIVSNIFGFKIFSSFIAVAIALVAAFLFGYSDQLINLLYIAVIVMVIESFVLSIYSIVRGFHNLKYESVATIIVHLVIMILGIVTVHFTKDISWLLLILVLAHGLNLIFGIFLLKRKFLFELKPAFDLIFWKKIFFIILPFALAAAFAKIWGAVDQVILAKLVDPHELGYYGVAYKLTFALQFLPLALMASLYPAMSRYFIENRQKLTELFSRAVNYLVLVTLPLIGGIFIFGKDLLISLYTEQFEPALLPLQILFVSLPLLFINFPLGALLNAANQQKRQSINIGISMIASIILNIFLIPKYNISGAALASLLSNFVYFILGWSSISKVIKYDYRRNLIIVAKIFVAVVIMVLASLYLTSTLNWLIGALLAVVIYFVFIYLLRVFSQREIKQLIDSFRK